MTALDAINEFQTKAIRFAEIWESYGFPIVFHAYYRGPQEQNEAYASGASKARYGQSAHNYYLAADYHFRDYGWNVPKAFWEFGDQIARYLGLESGVSYGDANHIQLKGWKNWKPYFLASGF